MDSQRVKKGATVIRLLECHGGNIDREDDGQDSRGGTERKVSVYGMYLEINPTVLPFGYGGKNKNQG